jgi:hypothetical protein
MFFLSNGRGGEEVVVASLSIVTLLSNNYAMTTLLYTFPILSALHSLTLSGLRIRIRIRIPMDPHQFELLDPDPGGQK